MKDVRPFFVPPAGAICADPWMIEVDQDWEPVEEHLRDWDQSTTLQLKCEITSDIDGVRRSTRLMADARLGWVAGWRAADSGLVGPPTVVEFGHEQTDLALTVPPDRAGGAIVLTRRLVLLQERAPAAGEAHRAGSILWDDEYSLRLTGSGSAFPTEIVDFGTGRASGSGASWYLDMPAAIDAAAMGSMLLEINAADADLVRAVTRARRPNDQESALLAQLEEGLVEEIVRWALVRWDHLQDPEPDSAGAVAYALTRRVLPDPATWTGHEVDSMALRAAIVSGARAAGFGRRL